MIYSRLEFQRTAQEHP